MQNTLNEIWQFMGALYGGLLIGVVYQMFHLFRSPFPNKWVNAALDVLFYAVAGVMTAATLLIVNGGVLRVFVLIAIAAGVWLYLSFAGSLMETLYKICKKLLVKRK